ncbi:hypothetical protein D9V32_15455 [Mycetocola tolaasinivorans]|uniref:Uncharacterized protein n=1 Tax=Mycetocola tolaasinivorans TaxID=76635 RepID=A0A3L6ZX70_9MICO|nr:hypothetical protein D9V32_15455 [Mycetocola tolaasinivorans]
MALLLGQVLSAVATGYSADLNAFLIFNFFAALIIGLLPAALAVRDIFRIRRNPPSDTTFRMASGGSFAIAITGLIIATLGALATAPAAFEAWGDEAERAQIRSGPPTEQEQRDVREVAAEMTTLVEGGLRTLGIDPAGRVETTFGSEAGEEGCRLSNSQVGTAVSVGAIVRLPETPADAIIPESDTPPPARQKAFAPTYWEPLKTYWDELGFRTLITDEFEPTLHAVVDTKGQLQSVQLGPASDAIRGGRGTLTDLAEESEAEERAASGAELSVTMDSFCVVDPER